MWYGITNRHRVWELAGFAWGCVVVIAKEEVSEKRAIRRKEEGSCKHTLTPGHDYLRLPL